MSTVKLTAFSVYKVLGEPGSPTAQIETLYGATAARFDGKHVQILADSVPFNSIKFKNRYPKPGFGLLMLYGLQDQREALHLYRTKARELKAEFASAEFEFDVGDIEVGFTGRDLLKKVNGSNRFLNVRRMKKDLQTDIVNAFRVCMNEDHSEEPLDDMRRIPQIATRPELFDTVLYEDEQLKQLDVVVIPVADDPAFSAKIRQLAYVKPGAKVVSTMQISTEASILLPSWMTDAKQAAKLRDSAA